MTEETSTPADPQAPADSQPSEAPSARERRPRLTAALPHMATAAVAIIASLLVQALLWPPAPAAPAAPAPAATAPRSPEPAATPAPTSAPRATPAPTPALGADSVLGLQILDLQEQNRRLRSAIFLLRAAGQINDTILALEGNDLAEADRTLLAVYRSLNLAYEFSAEQEKGPIDTFRLELSRIRDDLRVRPDGLDRRLRQLRQLILSLVDEGA